MSLFSLMMRIISPRWCWPKVVLSPVKPFTLALKKSDLAAVSFRLHLQWLVPRRCFRVLRLQAAVNSLIACPASKLCPDPLLPGTLGRQLKEVLNFLSETPVEIENLPPCWGCIPCIESKSWMQRVVPATTSVFWRAPQLPRRGLLWPQCKYSPRRSLQLQVRHLNEKSYRSMADLVFCLQSMPAWRKIHYCNALSSYSRTILLYTNTWSWKSYDPPN